MEHRAKKFKSQAFDDVQGSDCDPRSTVGGTEYSVVCPACRGHFTVAEKGIFRVGIFRRQPSAPSPIIPVVCECGFDHAVRPPDHPFTGCGAAWRLAL